MKNENHKAEDRKERSWRAWRKEIGLHWTSLRHGYKGNVGVLNLLKGEIVTKKVGPRLSL